MIGARSERGDHRIYRSADGRVTVVSGKPSHDVRPGSYSAYVPEVPTIVVTGQSVDEVTAKAGEAIRLYWEGKRMVVSPTSTFREIAVELPA
jgi:hypothetical protein